MTINREEILERKIKREKLARREAEKLLEEKSEELYNATQEQKLLLKKLYKAQRLEVIGRLSSVIAHDFNNIIASIEGYANFLQEDIEDPELKRYATNILKGLEQAHLVVSRVNEYSHQQKAPHVVFSLKKAFENSLVIFNSIKKKEVELVNNSPDFDIFLEGNKGQISDLIINILKNSNEAISNKGKITLDVTRKDFLDIDEHIKKEVTADMYHNVSGRKIFLESSIIIKVTDNGEGITEDTMRNLFKPYFTTKKESDGTGLGLFGVEGIVTAHGGCILYTSKEGEGTSCTIVLSEADLRALEIDHAEEASDKKSILVVDDEELVGNMLTERLKRMGHNAGYCSSGKEALTILKSSQGAWDLVITDEIMPEMQGTELLEEIKKFYTNLPVIIYSGYLGALESNDVLQKGASDVLAKPIKKEKLERALSKVFN